MKSLLKRLACGVFALLAMVGCGGDSPAGTLALTVTGAARWISSQEDLLAAAEAACGSCDGTIPFGAIKGLSDDDVGALQAVLNRALMIDGITAAEIVAQAEDSGLLPLEPVHSQEVLLVASFTQPCSNAGFLTASLTIGFFYVDSPIFDPPMGWTTLIAPGQIRVSFQNCELTGAADSLGQTGGGSPSVTLHGTLTQNYRETQSGTHPDVFTFTGALNATSATATWFGVDSTPIEINATSYVVDDADGGICIGGPVLRNNNFTDDDDQCIQNPIPLPGAWITATQFFDDATIGIFPES